MRRLSCFLLLIVVIVMGCACTKSNDVIRAERYSMFSTGMYTSQNNTHVFYYDSVDSVKGIYMQPISSSGQKRLVFGCDKPYAITASDKYLAVAVDAQSDSDRYAIYCTELDTKNTIAIPDEFKSIRDMFIIADALYCIYSDLSAPHTEKMFGDSFISMYSFEDDRYKVINEQFSYVGQYPMYPDTELLFSLYEYRAEPSLTINLCIRDDTKEMDYTVFHESRAILSSGGENFVFELRDGLCTKIGAGDNNGVDIASFTSKEAGGEYRTLSQIVAPELTDVSEYAWHGSCFGFMYETEHNSYIMLVQNYSYDSHDSEDNYLNSKHLYDCAYLIDEKLSHVLIYTARDMERIVYVTSDCLISFDGQSLFKITLDGAAEKITSLSVPITDCVIEGCGSSVYIYEDGSLLEVVSF